MLVQVATALQRPTQSATTEKLYHYLTMAVSKAIDLQLSTDDPQKRKRIQKKLDCLIDLRSELDDAADQLTVFVCPFCGINVTDERPLQAVLDAFQQKFPKLDIGELGYKCPKCETEFVYIDHVNIEKVERGWNPKSTKLFMPRLVRKSFEKCPEFTEILQVKLASNPAQEAWLFSINGEWFMNQNCEDTLVRLLRFDE